jgi:hypothetical protein
MTGFMVGRRYEQGGIIKEGARLINALGTGNCWSHDAAGTQFPAAVPACL